MERLQRRMARTSVPSQSSRFLWGPLQLFSVDSQVDVFLLLLPLLSLAVCFLSILLHAQASHARRFLLELLSRKESPDKAATDSTCVRRTEDGEGTKGHSGRETRDETGSIEARRGSRGGDNQEREAATETDKLRIALVVAHPDDEVMFFTPTLALLRDFPEHVKIHLLCLSTGNADGQGRVRSREFLSAASLFGIDKTEAVVVDRDDLQDGWAPWSPERVADVVEEFTESNDISTIFTFDAHGVSRHPNHISVYNGVRKYTGVLDIIWSTVACRKELNRIASVKLTPFLSIM
ncbi:hypothetical protein NCLIV_028260 [Neospora caninum Liverpool]|uniref:N-acetylglucosaminylphosphatidylinositol deacetylase n=1 Tax=Neospora caninum (strain Liverpool) TaxID=572307 RepID=F0VH43_NEOCL|nr:hypothetical protein NCLIV_028260 [Neospora caninum Liverpool]CBZ53037.1 hypothetical protein NCLIV_028260 [Neospora caninum Liverpool]|eukprot:XP_003883069.1 hypothetical protein NCLIV_028260 [Neospora caninum Liverpool]